MLYPAIIIQYLTIFRPYPAIPGHNKYNDMSFTLLKRYIILPIVVTMPLYYDTLTWLIRHIY